MLDFFGRLFDPSGFVPRKDCGEWTPALMWLHVGSDLFIWLAYLSIPLALVYFIRKRGDLPFSRLFVLFAAFILACGFTHFVEAMLFYHPVYRLSGLMKVVTAAVSWATVIALIPVIPRALELAAPKVTADTQQHRPVSGRRDGRILDYILAVLAGVLAILIRAALDTPLQSDHVFVVSLLAVVFVSWQCGFGPGLVTLLVSMLGFIFFFVSAPRRSFVVEGLGNQLAVALFFFCGVACCGLGEAQRFAQRRAKRALAAALEKQADLEIEVNRRRVVEYSLRQREDELIAAQREASEALAQLDAFFDNAPVGIAFFDPDLKYRRVNAFLAASNGLAVADFTGKRFRDVIPGVPAEVEDVYRQTARPGAGPATRVVRHADPADPSRAKTWQVTTFPVQAAAGQSLGLGVIAEDVTERERAAETVRDSEAYLRGVLDNSPDCVKVLSTDGHLLEMNRPGQCLMEIDDFAPFAGRDWAGMWEGQEDVVRRAVATAGGGAVARFQGPGNTAKGTPRFWDVQVAPIPGPDGRPVRLVSVSRDITEYRRAEQALRESEATLRAFYDNSPLNMGIVELTYDGADIRHVYDNPASCRFFGVPAGGTTGQLASALGATPGTIAAWRKHYRESAATRAAVRFDHTYDAPDGARWLAVTVSAIPTPAGTPTRYCYVAEDVTERQRAEREMRLSEARFRTLAAAVPQIVWVTRPDGYHEYYNAKWYEYTGLTEAESIGFGWSGPLHPDDTARAEARWKQSTDTGDEYDIEYRFRGADGEYRWFLGRALPQRDDAGNVVRWFGTCTDIHDAKVGEEQVRLLNAELSARMGELQSVLDAAPAAIWIARDPACLDVTGNRTSFELLRTPADENISASVAPAARRFREQRGGVPVPPDQLPLQLAARTGVPQAGVELELVFGDGSVRHIYGNTAPLLDGAGRPRGALGAFIDITDRKRAEEAQAERVRLAALRADVATALGGDAAVPAVLQACCAAVVKHLSAAFARVWTLDEPGGTLDLQASAGLYTHTDGPHGRVPVGAFKIGRIAESRQALVTNDVPNDPNVSDPAWARREGMTAFAGYPLLVEGRVLGVLAVFGRAAFTPALLADLAPLADSVAQYLDRKKAAAALREREAEFRMMAESIAQLAWMARPDGHIFWYNRRWYEYTGTTPADMEGWGWQAVHDPAVLPTVLERWQKSIADGEPFEMVFPLKGADGRFRPFLTRVHPSKEAGRVVRWFGTNTDVSAAEEAADKLRASEERFRTLTEAVPNIVWNADADGHPTYFNSRWVEYTGIHVDEVAPIGPSGWLIAAHPDDHRRVAAAWRDTVTRVAEGQDDRFSQELRLRRAGTDDYRWFLTVVAPLRRPDGSVDQWIGSMADIHDQKTATEAVRASAERFRTLSETVPQMVWTADPRGTVTHFNRRWDEYTGRPLADGNARGWDATVHPDDSTKVNTSWQLAVAQGSDHYAQEFRLRRAADGAYRWMLSNAVPLRTPAGEVAEWVGSLTDIDDQKRQAETLERTVRERTAELEQTNERLVEEVAERARAEELVAATAQDLKRSNEELEQFAYIASHDLQEPLRKIQSFGDLLKTKYREQLPDEGKAYTDKMLTSAGRMRRLIDDLLSLSRVTSQGKPYTRVGLTELVEQVAGDLDLRIEQAGGRVDVAALPAIDADPSQIRQLFQNLIANALKFRKAGVPPVVRVRGEIAGDECRLTVEDNGIGFEEKYQDRIFQVFQRLHGRDEYEGTGVGLAICQKIVERHGGTIRAEGRPGEGATFVVTLPARQAAKDAAG